MNLSKHLSLAVAAVLLSSCSTGGQKAPGSTDSQAREQAIRDSTDLITGTHGVEAPSGPDQETVVVDPKTGVRLLRIPKSNQYFTKGGELFNIVMSDRIGIPIVREDEQAYYVQALPERTTDAKAGKKAAAATGTEDLRVIADIPEIEAEVVTPKRSKVTVRFEEISQGLPTMGQWRENFALADLDGDGRLDIVAPPPRMSANEIAAWRFDKTGWKELPLKFENPDGLDFGFGGLAVGDVDGDGKLDIVYGTHSGGLTFARGLGGLSFRLETRGLPREMASRAVELGDIDGDGRLDVMAVNETPEKLALDQKQIDDLIKPVPEADKGKYRKGFEARSFLFKGDRFEELTDGLGSACWGYTLGLHIPKPGAGPDEVPFYVSSCRTAGIQALAYYFDRKERRWRGIGLDTIEAYAAHLGSAVGTYKGKPAAFVSYMKVGPSSGRKITGDGVSIYYPDGATWARKRVVKHVDPERKGGQQGIAVGDLDGDGLDDIVWADEVAQKLRIFFQTPSGEFEEMNSATAPSFVNQPTCLRIADIDGDGRNDIVMMFQARTSDRTRAGGLRFFRNVR